jgi:hypothetical protein
MQSPLFLLRGRPIDRLGGRSAEYVVGESGKGLCIYGVDRKAISVACDFDWECREAKAKCSVEDCERKLMEFALIFSHLAIGGGRDHLIVAEPSLSRPTIMTP